MGLSEPILAVLQQKKIIDPTPIQEQSIPHILQGEDVLGIAKTGTGKTFAFVLPTLQLLVQERATDTATALIITPTRELAFQIEEAIRMFEQATRIHSTVIVGGAPQGKQVQALKRRPQIVVATPGRLQDLLDQKKINLRSTTHVILDEADRMLDMGFIRDIEKIVKLLPAVRQTMLFSATMPNDIARIANKLLKNPERVEVTPESTTVEKIEQKVNMIDGTLKPIFLKHILKDQSIKSVLVFTRTKHGADRVVRHLEKDRIQSAAIHGNKSQNARERALGDFKAGKIRVLVATDIAARGIDISQVSHVINYNLPEDPKSYVHRIGRTARAGRSGVAISFCDESEVKFLKGIEKLINIKIPVDKSHLSMHRN